MQPLQSNAKKSLSWEKGVCGSSYWCRFFRNPTEFDSQSFRIFQILFLTEIFAKPCIIIVKLHFIDIRVEQEYRKQLRRLQSSIQTQVSGWKS